MTKSKKKDAGIVNSLRRRLMQVKTAETDVVFVKQYCQTLAPHVMERRSG